MRKEEAGGAESDFCRCGGLSLPEPPLLLAPEASAQLTPSHPAPHLPLSVTKGRGLPFPGPEKMGHLCLLLHMARAEGAKVLNTVPGPEPQPSTSQRQRGVALSQRAPCAGGLLCGGWGSLEKLHDVV